MTTPLPTNVDATDWNADADKGAQEHRSWHDSIHTGYNAGDHFRTGFYSYNMYTAALTAGSMSAGLLQVRPWPVFRTRAFDRVGINVTTAAAAGGKIRLGLYGSGGGYPANLVADWGVVDTTTTGFKEIVIAATLHPGVHWLAMLSETAGCQTTCFPGSAGHPWIAPQTTPLTTALYTGWSKSSVAAGAIPVDSAGLAPVSQLLCATSLRPA